MAKKEPKPPKKEKLPKAVKTLKEPKPPKVPKPPKAVKLPKEPKPSKKASTKPEKSAKKDRLSRVSSRASLRSAVSQKPTKANTLPPDPNTLSRSPSKRVVISAEHPSAAPTSVKLDGPSRFTSRRPAKSGPLGPATNATHVLVDRLPQAFGLYNHSILDPDIYIATKQHDPPLFSIELTNGGFLRIHKQCIKLYRGKGKSSKTGPIATAQFPVSAMFTNIGAKFEICVFDPDKPSEPPLLRENMEGTILFKGTSNNKFFDFKPPGSGRKEVFEWRGSTGQAVQNLNGWSHGLKLVRVRTGEVLAAWVIPAMPIGTTKKGKMEFLGDRSLGPEFEFLGLMSLVTDRERSRRNQAR